MRTEMKNRGKVKISPVNSRINMLRTQRDIEQARRSISIRKEERLEEQIQKLKEQIVFINSNIKEYDRKITIINKELKENEI